MLERLITLCIALMSLAVVVPAFASAAPTLRESGALVSVNSEITATNVGATTLTATNASGATVGVLSCAKADITGTVTANNATAGVAGDITAASFTNETGGGCTSTIPFWGNPTVDVLNLPYCLSSTVFGTATLSGGNCGESGKILTFKLTFPIGLSCAYSATNIVGAYKAEDGTEATHLTFTNQVFTLEAGQSEACAAKIDLSTTFRLETKANGAALAVSP